MNQELAEFDGQEAELDAYLVVFSGRISSTPPTARDCELVRTNNGLTRATVLYDPEGRLRDLGITGRHYHRILGPGSKLEFAEQFRDGGYLDALRNLLSQP